MPLFDLVDSVTDKMFDVTASVIDYRRGGQELFVNIKAKVGQTLFRADTAAGLTIRIEQRDFIVRASDVAAMEEPKKGDEIVWQGKKYMVFAPNGEPCWRWHTRQSHTQLRIHAKYIGDDPLDEEA